MSANRVVLAVSSLALAALLLAGQVGTGGGGNGKDGRPSGGGPGEDPAEAILKPLNGKVKREGGSRDGAVVEVILYKQGVTDADLKELAQFDKLRKVGLNRGEQVTGTGFRELAGLPLEELALSFSGVTDEGLKEIAKIKVLRVLDLTNASKITDDGLPALAALENLEELRVGQNFKVMDVGVSRAIARMPKLRKLDITNSSVGDGALKQAAESNPELRVLVMYGSQATDAGMKYVARLKHLEELATSRGSGMTDKGLAELSGLTELRSLDVNNTFVTVGGLLKSPLLPRLKKLHIGGPHQRNITDAQVEQLRTAAPNCNVIKD
jgi:hypothetical protein